LHVHGSLWRLVSTNWLLSTRSAFWYGNVWAERRTFENLLCW
jgi:hypothetical protein